MGESKLLTELSAQPRAILAQRLEDARLLLRLHGYLRDSESDRIRNKLDADWEQAITDALGGDDAES